KEYDVKKKLSLGAHTERKSRILRSPLSDRPAGGSGEDSPAAGGGGGRRSRRTRCPPGSTTPSCSAASPSRLLNSGNFLHGGATESLLDLVGSAVFYTAAAQTRGSSLY
uniref:Uncharacterized protein n=1 Tax=Aegilops tauschii subsp. strangulata TaxID=200361 RepID=A0A453JIL2_AEGTS